MVINHLQGVSGAWPETNTQILLGARNRKYKTASLRFDLAVGRFRGKCLTKFSLSQRNDKLKLIGHLTAAAWVVGHLQV